jgi:hypothetical protein
MKKLAFIALLLLSFSNVFAGNEFEAPALETAQEIILTEVYDIMPLDDPKDEGRGNGFDPNKFHAFINDNLLFVAAHTNAPAYVEVINQETGEVVVEEYFDGEIEFPLDQIGLFTIQIYSNYTAVAGDFVLE